MKSNRNYVTENINLKQQVINLKVANKDKAETIKSMKQELLEYSQLRDRFKVLYEETQKLKKAIDWLKHTFEITLDSKVRISDGIDCIQAFPIDMKNNEVIYELLKEVLGND